jgi:hypothetical protein
MVILILLLSLACAFAADVQMHTEQKNLFDTGIHQLQLLHEMGNRKIEILERLNIFKNSSKAFKKGFKEFVQQNKSTNLNSENFKELKQFCADFFLDRNRPFTFPSTKSDFYFELCIKLSNEHKNMRSIVDVSDNIKQFFLSQKCDMSIPVNCGEPILYLELYNQWRKMSTQILLFNLCYSISQSTNGQSSLFELLEAFYKV